MNLENPFLSDVWMWSACALCVISPVLIIGGFIWMVVKGEEESVDAILCVLMGWMFAALSFGMVSMTWLTEGRDLEGGTLLVTCGWMLSTTVYVMLRHILKETSRQK